MISSPGRPRDEQSRKSILQATFRLLRERGYESLALEGVAREAGVGKTTIYRWWAGRAALAVDAFFDETVTELSFPETGSASEDFRQQIQQLAKLLRSERGEVLAALIIGSRTDKDLVESIQQYWVRPRKEWGFARMMRAITEGECVAELNVPCALESLYTPLYARLFLGIPVHSAREINRHCDFLFPSIFRAPSWTGAKADS
ncbi:MAG: TetR/AcrR family transcriptional regulator [Bryobacteraceae bacterium]|nr:TetR/AcrR family transcriptional regulator [Bryobacteraceae bacterium]